jgi:hypothetical protein
MVEPRRSGRKNGPGTGLGVDYTGGPVVDPTVNVIALVEANAKAASALREADNRYYDEVMRNLKEMNHLRAFHQRELDGAESARLDSIRQVDREDVNKTAVAAQAAITTLATTTNTMAETLRNQVATVAGVAESRQAAFAGDVNKRLSALELSSSEGKGKQTVSDPQMEKLTALVETLARNQVSGSGKSEGISWVGALIVGVVSVMGGLITISAVLYAVLKP